MRFIPLNLALLTADKLGIELPQRFQDARSIDKMGEWACRCTFGKEQVLELYANSGNGGASNMDMTHFSPQISDELVRCFAGGEYRLAPEQVSETEAQILQNIETLLAENPEIPTLRS